MVGTKITNSGIICKGCGKRVNILVCFGSVCPACEAAHLTGESREDCERFNNPSVYDVFPEEK